MCVSCVCVCVHVCVCVCPLHVYVMSGFNYTHFITYTYLLLYFTGIRFVHTPPILYNIHLPSSVLHGYTVCPHTSHARCYLHVCTTTSWYTHVYLQCGSHLALSRLPWDTVQVTMDSLVTMDMLVTMDALVTLLSPIAVSFCYHFCMHFYTTICIA